MQKGLSILRVATRFHKEVVATFISDKWFKAKKAELLVALKAPIQSHTSEMWAYLLRENVGVFLTKFEEEFRSLVTFEAALESVQHRVRNAQDVIKDIAHSLDLIGDHRFYDFKDPVQYLKWRAHSPLYDKIASTTKVLGGFFKWSWTIDEAAIDRLVQRTIKKATPEQLEALVAENNDRSFAIGYQFLVGIGFEEAALRTLKRTKLSKFDPIKWLDWIYETLKANYSEQAVGDQGMYREFDMYGMKVVIKDDTVTHDDVKKYIKYIDEAYIRMKAKGFEKAWYGTFYIECLKCGGVNHNTGGGVGGHFVIGPDTVSCFERPSKFVVELLAHELGHRYWFKQMTPDKRSKFESLVKVRPTAKRPDPENSKDPSIVEDWDRKFREDVRPVVPVSDYGGSNIDEAFAEAFAHYVLDKAMDRNQLESFKSVLAFTCNPRAVILVQRYLGVNDKTH